MGEKSVGELTFRGSRCSLVDLIGLPPAKVSEQKNPFVVSESPRKLIAIFKAPENWVSPVVWPLKDFPGLERVELGRGNGACRVVTIWVQSDDVVEQVLRFGALGLGDPEWQAPVTGGPSAAKESFVKKWLRPAVLLPAVLAMLGGFEALRHHYAVLLAAPSFAVRSAKAGPVDVVAGVPAKVEIEFKNLARVGECGMKLKSVGITPAPAAIRSWLDANAAARDAGFGKNLAPGEKVTEVLALPEMPAGDYRLALCHEGRSGFFRGAATVTSEIGLRVWPPWEIGLKDVAPTESGCEVTFEIRLGRGYPSGARLEAILSPAHELEIVSLTIRGIDGFRRDPPQRTGDGPAAVAKQRVFLPPTEALTKREGLVYLGGNPRTYDEWRKIGADLVANITLDHL